MTNKCLPSYPVHAYLISIFRKSVADNPISTISLACRLEDHARGAGVMVRAIHLLRTYPAVLLHSMVTSHTCTHLPVLRLAYFHPHTWLISDLLSDKDSLSLYPVLTKQVGLPVCPLWAFPRISHPVLCAACATAAMYPAWQRQNYKLPTSADMSLSPVDCVGVLWCN